MFFSLSISNLLLYNNRSKNKVTASHNQINVEKEQKKNRNRCRMQKILSFLFSGLQNEAERLITSVL